MTSYALQPRVAPRLPGLFGTRRSVRLVERNMASYRRMWILLITGCFEPIFYLLSLGVGLGKLIPDVTGPGGAPVTYVHFVAPALLATAAMNGAMYDSTFGIFHRLKYGKVYAAVLATPLTPPDIALGELIWCLMRGGMYAVAFTAVVAFFGVLTSPWAILAIPAALLIGLGFAGLGMAIATFMKSWQDFEVVNLLMMPMFLFSTTFFPLGVYPRGLQLFVEITPLYQGIEIIRDLMLGVVGPSLLLRCLYLAVMAVGGLTIAARRFGRLLTA
ncbi:MAG TPA: ABC transporter permease [Actinospica sp.]|jgi:lipooligosaccharide transport system permease protein|nr:ABC transporter permease [Actinospica sp.]